VSLFLFFERLFVARLPLPVKLGLSAVVLVVEFRVYNSESQVQEEECTYKDEWHEEQTRPLVRGLLYLNHDFRPAFQGHGLEDDEQCVEEVVKVRNAVVGVLVPLSTRVHLALLPLVPPSLVRALEAATKVVWLIKRSSLDVKAPLLQVTGEQLQPCYREDHEEEEQHNHRVSQQRQRGDEGLDKYAQTLYILNCS